jgi:hypothetical protein
MHRTCEHHTREEGRDEYLPGMSNLFPTSSDPVEAERMKIEHFACNREIELMLRDKGFDFGFKWSDED